MTLDPRDLLQDDRGKGHRHGCHRLIDPAKTVARLRPLMPLLGITRVGNITGLDRIGVPVVMVCRPNARSVAVSLGKGLTLDAATASGLMEAAELFHAERIDLPLRLGSRAQIGGEVIDLARLPHISGRYHDDLVMLWTQGVDLISGRTRWLPYEVVRADFALPPPPGSGCFACSTNGLASGNNMAEAICHAICEVVERDATTLWTLCPTRGHRGLDLGTVTDAACQSVMDRLSRAGFEVLVWETTTDTAIASFFCLIADRRDPLAHHGIGAGAHPAPEIALLRALTEAAQTRTTYISGARDDLSPRDYGQAELVRKTEIAAIWRAEWRPLRDFGRIKGCDAPSFADDLAWLLARVQGAGITEVVAVDLRKPALGLAVARVVIPGLEGAHDQPGYTPGTRARRWM